MADIDDILGQQQDDIVRSRFDLEQARKQTDAFDGCNSLFDFCCRMVELGDEPGMRDELGIGLNRIRQSFDARPWVEQLAEAIQAKDKGAFEQLYQRATTAAVMS